MAFVPQDPNKSAELFSHELRSGLSWRLFVFFLITFSIAILSYFGLQFGYKLFLERSIANYDKLLEESRTKIGITEQKNLIAFYSQMINLKSLFKSHIFGSKLFEFLEKSTNVRVAYASANLSAPERELSLDGVTDSYETLVSQVISFENHSGVDRVILGSNSFDGNLVKFSLKVVFKPNFFQ